MKKLYKKISIILVSIIIINALLSNIVFAEEKLTEEQLNDPLLSQTQTDHSQVQTKEDMEKYAGTGEATGSSDERRPTNRYDDNQKKINIPISEKHDRDTNLQSEQSSMIASLLASFINLLASVVQCIMTQAVGATYEMGNFFTIQNLLMGKYELFDINIFDKNINYETSSDISKQIKISVTNWYSTIRTIAIIANLIVLLYIAIRMAMTTTVDDRVRYKKMLLGWVQGFVLIFVLHYLVLILITLSDQIVKTLCELIPSTSQQVPFEYAVMERITAATTYGWSTFLQSILYAMLVWYAAKFFYMYLKRVISNAFLILVSPLVTITYAIDKSNDCKAQAFNAWLDEIITNIFIQPLHLLLFIVLLYSAGAIAELYPIIAILFMLGLSKAEKLLRGLLKLRGSTIDGVDDGTTFTGLIGMKL